MSDNRVSLEHEAPPIGKRYLCGVLENLRACVKTLNFSILPSLIEEAQFQGERLEAGLDQHREKRWGMYGDLKKALKLNDAELRAVVEGIVKKEE